MCETPIVIEVSSDSDITRSVRQCKDHVLTLANGSCDCLPGPLDLEQTDIWATG
jgi:hypothetical protein